MSTLREAAQQALEAYDQHEPLAVVMEALRAALAEPVQEPVAWSHINGTSDTKWHPPQRKPLTEEEIDKAYREIWRDLPSDFDHTSSGWIEQGIRYAERAHGIK